MSQQAYRANLSAASFPFQLSRSGGQVIIPGPDQHYDRRVDPEGEQKNPGIPQSLYLENVLPTASGYQSAGFYDGAVLPFPATEAVFLEIKRPDGTFPVQVAFRTTLKQVYVADLLGNFNLVGNTGDLIPFPSNPDAYSYAVVRGKIYVWTGREMFLYTYGGTGTFQVTTASFTPAGVLTDTIAITSSNNYLILVKNIGSTVSVLHSSTITEMDFTPSLVTGAGGGSIGNTEGSAVCARNAPNGFYIYTYSNVIYATFTGNARYPFKYVPVLDAPGVKSGVQVYGDLDESVHVYLTAGNVLRIIQGGSSRVVSPELSEHLEKARSYDSFNPATGLFTQNRLPRGYILLRPYVFESRYICVSVSESTSINPKLYDAVYVFDLTLNRMGRLKFRHAHLCSTPLPQESLGDLRVDRPVLSGVNPTNNRIIQVVYRTDLEVDSNEITHPHSAVLLLGRFQYSRSRDIAMDEVQLQGPNYGSLIAPFGVSLKLLPSRNGQNFLPAEAPFLRTEQSSAAVLTYAATTESHNVSFLIQGTFDLSAVEMKFHLGAKTS